MENEEVTKLIGEGTSGLTSASQLVNTTSYITFAETNSTCATLISRKEKFVEVLKASLQKNKQILQELAKY